MATKLDAKLLKSSDFPPEFDQKVDTTKVDLRFITEWISRKLEILGSKDDVVTRICRESIEGSRFPDIKSLRIRLMGFLDNDATPFCQELWNLCLNDQASSLRAPKELFERKKGGPVQEELEADEATAENWKIREGFESRQRRSGRRGNRFSGLQVSRDSLEEGELSGKVSLHKTESVLKLGSGFC